MATPQNVMEGGKHGRPRQAGGVTTRQFDKALLTHRGDTDGFVDRRRFHHMRLLQSVMVCAVKV